MAGGRWLAGVIAGLLLLPTGALAASQPPTQALIGISISPIYQNVSIDLNQPRARYEITLTNHTAAAQAFKLSVLDFGSLNESGGVAFLGTSSSDFARTFGLSDWMKLDEEAVTVPAAGKAQIGITVTNSASLRTGGHYGAVLATALTAPNGPAVSSRVGVLEVLSSLLLLVKGGGAVPDLRLVSQTVNQSGRQLPTSVEDRFQNAGEVHVVPRGVVEIRDPLGRVVARGALNEDSGIILPQTYRRYTTPLVKLVRAWLPGRYTTQVVYRYDGSTDVKTFTSSFWYAGSVSTWAIAAALLLMIAAIAWWLSRRRRVKR